MKLEFEGRMWELDHSRVGLKQAVVMQGLTGKSLTQWEKNLTEPDDPGWLESVQCLYWLMLAQNGEQVPLADVDFDVMAFYLEFARAGAEQAAAAAGEAADPTRPGGGTAGAEPLRPGPATG